MSTPGIGREGASVRALVSDMQRGVYQRVKLRARFAFSGPGDLCFVAGHDLGPYRIQMSRRWDVVFFEWRSHNIPLSTKPIVLRLSLGSAVGAPQVVRTLANRFFHIRHGHILSVGIDHIRIHASRRLTASYRVKSTRDRDQKWRPVPDRLTATPPPARLIALQ